MIFTMGAPCEGILRVSLTKLTLAPPTPLRGSFHHVPRRPEDYYRPGNFKRGPYAVVLDDAGAIGLDTRFGLRSRYAVLCGVFHRAGTGGTGALMRRK